MRFLSALVPALIVAAVMALASGGQADAVAQPVSLWLPWEGGGLWSYTQGPHGGSGEALDFAPPDSGGGCDDTLSSFWATAAADGTVTRRANGVEIDHGDGFGTGYYHLGNVQVANGQEVVAGERLGNPGCCPDGPVEGCWATGRHLHFYTIYNGTRQPVAGINLGGWYVGGDGCLSRAEQMVCADSRIVSNSPDPENAASSRADIVVLLDTSWSVALDPGEADRSDVALALMQAARDDDRVSVINFNKRVDTRSPLRTVESEDALDPVLASAVEAGQDFGRTDLRMGLSAACRELLARGEVNARAVILVSDGRDTVNRQRGGEECLAHHGIPVFAYRLGNDAAPRLDSIAESTGGQVKALSEIANLYCEFREVRGLISGDAPGRCSALRIEPGESLSLPFTIPALQDAATMEIRWQQRPLPGAEAGQDISLKTTVLAPSRNKLSTPYPGIEVTEDSGSISFHILRPVRGTWSLSVSGESLPEEGVYVTFAAHTIAQAPPPAEPTPAPSETPSPGPTDPPTETPEPTPTPVERATPKATTPDTQTETPTETPRPTKPPEPTPEPQPTPTSS